MGDNVAWTAGSGTTIATDEINGVHFQKVFAMAGNTAIAIAGLTVTGNGELALPSSPLADRKRVILQNRSTIHPLYLGPTGVTYSTGLEILPGAIATLELGPAVTLYGLSEAGGTCNVRVFEIS